MCVIVPVWSDCSDAIHCVIKRSSKVAAAVRHRQLMPLGAVTLVVVLLLWRAICCFVRLLGTSVVECCKGLSRVVGEHGSRD